MSRNIEKEIIESSQLDPHDIQSPDTARLVIDGGRVIASHNIEGIKIHAKPFTDGIDVSIVVSDNVEIERPVHLCFGMLPEKGVQKIILNSVIGINSKIKIKGHCTFPNAVDITHIMEGNVLVREGADYTYFERHVHSETGGIKVIPNTRVKLEKNARFKTEFELLQGRVGSIDIHYEIDQDERSQAEMNSRINGKANDSIKIVENAILNGEYARAILTSKVAVRNNANARIHNTIIANAAYSRGHVDCKEIVKDNGIAIAVPTVDVRNAKAHVTHEAAVGDVDKKQLETLMSRGLNEDEASELIIQGMLS
jgi:hypothetical protein